MILNWEEAKKLAKPLAELKGKILRKQATPTEQSMWASIPTISADVKEGDVVKDYSINSGGQAGIVFNVREMRKRTGQMVTVVEFVFFAPSNLYEMRTRKIEFKK